MTDHTPHRLNYRGILLLAVLCFSLTGCASEWHWPWKHKPAPAPQPVHYVNVVSESAGTINQYWDRNTLQFDLTAVSGEGVATVSPIKSVGWPIRLEFLVRPGSFAVLEVVAAQRVVLQVPAQGKNLVLKLAQGVYLPDSESLTLRWSAADDWAR
jgi:hypothetical protein